MEDKPFKEITLMTRQLGKMKVITSIMQAAEFIVNEWPGTDTERLDIAKHALLECYDGTLSPGIVAWLLLMQQRKPTFTSRQLVARHQTTNWKSGARERCGAELNRTSL
ncbi:hypothetical protein QFZ34_002217 [Phyllobacterium ifriqiyense]|uniref:DUF982 domain-containing protein n=2 Tax=Phyllobacterium ifriqiyense TaxID=314238 RepID=A0ABU0S8H2_9HYPH|nr:hypothetical protein [Phyllobacterium ifriqiyense]